MPLSKHPLFTRDEIRTKVSELAQQVDARLSGHEVVALIVLKGGLHFGSDLLRAMHLPVAVDFIRARSYDGTASRGHVEILLRPSLGIAGKHVLLIEDILDTGVTARAILDVVRAQEPTGISLCALFDKPARRAVDLTADFTGFTVEDRFLVGYGMDFEERFRELPEVYAFE